MAVLDGVLLGILVVSMLLGAWRGLVFELFSLVGWVVGFSLHDCLLQMWQPGCRWMVLIQPCNTVLVLCWPLC